MSSEVFLVRMIGDEHGKPTKGPVTVLAFIHPNESRANSLAGEALDAMHDLTGLKYGYIVEPIRYISTFNEHEIYRMARDAAQAGEGEPVTPAIARRSYGEEEST